MLIDVLTYTASLRTGIEPVNLDHLCPVLRSYVLKLLDKRAEGEVIDLAPPQTCHAEKTQVLDADGIVPTTQVMARLPLPVVATVTDAFMATLQILSPPASMAGAFLAARQRPGLTAKLVQAGLQEFFV